METITVYYQTDHSVEFTDLDLPDRTPNTTSTMSLTIYTHADVAVGNPISATHLGEGVYSVPIPSTLPVEVGCRYYGILRVTDSGGNKDTVKYPVVVEYRT